MPWRKNPSPNWTPNLEADLRSGLVEAITLSGRAGGLLRLQFCGDFTYGKTNDTTQKALLLRALQIERAIRQEGLGQRQRVISEMGKDTVGGGAGHIQLLGKGKEIITSYIPKSIGFANRHG
jgi:hypothetical protein